MTLPKMLAAMVVLVLLVVGAFWHLAPTTATLTFTGDRIVFEDEGIKIGYFLPEMVGGEVMPGWKARSFEKKIVTKDDEETDVSELTLERVSEPDRVMVLVIGKPLPVVPVREDEGRIWVPAW